jgi:hypothetical protein
MGRARIQRGAGASASGLARHRRTAVRLTTTVAVVVAALMAQVFVAPAASAAPPPVTAQGNVPPGTQFALADGTTDNTLRDLGLSTGLSDGRRLWALGDTFEPHPAQSGVHPNTAAFTNPNAPGTFVEPKDTNGHRYNFVPLTAAESAYNNGLRLVTVPAQRMADTRNAAGQAYPPDRPAGPVASINAWQQLAIDFNPDGSPIMDELANVDMMLLNVTVFNQTADATSVKMTQPFGTPTTQLIPLAGGETASIVTPVQLGLGRYVLFQHTVGSVHMTIDLVGYYRETATSKFQPTNPTTIWDNTCSPGGTLGNTTRTVQVTGTTCKGNSVVPTGATAVVVSLAAITPAASTSRITLWRADQAEPVPPSGANTATDNMANLNLAASQSRRALAVVPLSPSGQLKLANVGTGVTASLNVVGYHASGGADEFIPLDPITVCDTRVSTSSCASGKVQAGTARTFTLPPSQVPAGVTSVMLRVTAVNPALATGVTSSTVSVVAGGAGNAGGAVVIGRTGTRSATTVSKVAANGSVTVRNSSGAVDVVIDLLGFTASRASITETCAQPGPQRPRIALWPSSMVTVRQPDRNGVMADRVIIHYVDLIVCHIDLGYQFRGKGVAEYWYYSGQPANQPIIATRLNDSLNLGTGTSRFDWGNGGIVRNGFLYLYGCQALYDPPPPPESPNGCSITRTPLPTSASDVAFAQPGSYRYWNGSGFGASSDAGTAQLITMSDTTTPWLGELPGAGMSVEFIPQWGPSGMYVMAYEPWPVVATETVVIRTAANPEGPWSNPVNGTAQVTIDDCVAGERGCYTVRINPAMTTSNRLGLSYLRTSDGTLRYSQLPVTVTA